MTRRHCGTSVPCCLERGVQACWLRQVPVFRTEALCRVLYPTSMLCVCMLSGEEVASIPVVEVSSVKEVKQRLHELHGLPPRFRQRLILQGADLDDADKVDSSLDLNVILQPFSRVSLAAALVDAAARNAAEEAAVSGASVQFNDMPRNTEP